MALESLASLLCRYRPSDSREEAFVRRMQALLSTHSAPFARTSYEPGHFTASAFVLSPERDSVLLIFHNKLRLWVQPGGHIDESDFEVAGAAKREVAEEVGLSSLSPLDPDTPIFDVDIHSIPGRVTEPAHEHFDVRFAFVAASRDVRPNAEVQNPRWVRLDQAQAVTTDRSVLRAVEKLSAHF